MRRLPSLIAIFFIALVGSAFGQTGGRDLYVAKCSACHAPDASGNNTIGRSLKLSDMRPAIKNMTDEQLRQIILEGKGRMPRIKNFDDEKVRNLILFLRDLAAGNPNTGRAVTEAQAQPLPHVDTVFQDKCTACHAQDGTGRTTIGKSLKIPDLTSAAVQSHSAEELAEVISKGKGRMPGYAKTFNPVQVGQFVSYIRGLTQSSGERAPVESAKPSVSIPQPPPSLPTQVTGQPESKPPAPNSAGGTARKKSSEVEQRNTVEPKLNKVQAATTAPRSGRQIYIAKCSACHSSDGSGAGTIGKSMRIPSLTSPQVQAQSDETLANVISNGAGKMPGYKKKYSPEQIQLLVAYIRELGRKH
jgi:mono/diheme cytochrome c family protein